MHTCVNPAPHNMLDETSCNCSKPMLVYIIEILKFALLAITSIVAVMELASTIAVYVTLTKDTDLEKKRRIVSKSMKISFLVLAFFAFTGHLLFSIFNITISAFKVAGGMHACI